MTAPAETFWPELKQCIQSQAELIASTRFVWGDRCTSASEKIGWQAAKQDVNLSPMMDRHGHTGALWCAFYAARMMSGTYYKPYAEWYAHLLCPWDLDFCGDEALGLHGDERLGVPLEWAGGQGAARDGEGQRTMSCGRGWTGPTPQ